LAREEVRLRAISVVRESERLNDVARDTIKEILGEKTHQITAMELAAATKLRDEDHHNEFFEMDRLNRHLNRLCYITGGILGSVILLAVVGAALHHRVFPSNSILLGVICFGGLGAAVSMMISIAPLVDGSIPKQLRTGLLLFARPLLGASAAVAVYAFIMMGVLAPTLVTTPFTYLAFAFAAGFSDQLLLSAVSKVATSSSESAKRKDHK